MEYLYNFVFSSGEYCECDPGTSGCDHTIDNCGYNYDYDYDYGTAYFDIFVKECGSAAPTAASTENPTERGGDAVAMIFKTESYAEWNFVSPDLPSDNK